MTIKNGIEHFSYDYYMKNLDNVKFPIDVKNNKSRKIRSHKNAEHVFKLFNYIGMSASLFYLLKGTKYLDVNLYGGSS